LNYLENFLSNYLLMLTDEEDVVNVFPVFIAAVKNKSTSLPVKKYVAKFFATLFHTHPS